MSVLALCGNSGVILLSVKRQNTLILQFRRYTVQAPHKAGAGRGNPEFNIEHNRAHAVFLVMSIATPKLWWGVQGQFRLGRVLC